ncbi:hypothetical protein GCM10019059_42360 [Camelimonas fluminis]|uniref:Uncharacterized protein n=1 Tax=Camelimonas fluminis TaxID=1576911 RepID=A0ABV7UMZ8_9HYPH|nr:hypothetical protein [Camelimonas fluminis]GHE79368.1 hypothetical protein GCM10019059_42360 [Camelimonas fluminis]
MQPSTLPYVEAGTPDSDGTIHFWDRSKHRSWLISQEFARRIEHDPSLLEAMRTSLRKWQNNQSLETACRTWQRLLGEGAKKVAHQITALTPEGEYLRDTLPSPGPLPLEVLQQITAVQLEQIAHGKVVYESKRFAPV